MLSKVFFSFFSCSSFVSLPSISNDKIKSICRHWEFFFFASLYFLWWNHIKWLFASRKDRLVTGLWQTKVLSWNLWVANAHFVCSKYKLILLNYIGNIVNIEKNCCDYDWKYEAEAKSCNFPGKVKAKANFFRQFKKYYIKEGNVAVIIIFRDFGSFFDRC